MAHAVHNKTIGLLLIYFILHSFPSSPDAANNEKTLYSTNVKQETVVSPAWLFNVGKLCESHN